MFNNKLINDPSDATEASTSAGGGGRESPAMMQLARCSGHHDARNDAPPSRHRVMPISGEPAGTFVIVGGGACAQLGDR
jgi:hypothetical protein